MFETSAANRRKPAVAGQFYPDNPRQLTDQLKQLFNDSRTFIASGIKALIAPHAGYVYSGHTAASAYLTLLPQADKIDRVILLGPSHRVGFHGVATSSANFFETPLGDIAIDRAAMRSIESMPQVVQMDRAHQYEHSLEVHLPFLQSLLHDFKLVPLVVGDCPAQQVAEVLEALWGGEETLIVISSDLSHYHPYEQACAMDQKTTQSILDMKPEMIGFDDACGQIPIRGLLMAAKQHELKPELVELCNSGDTAGSKDHVVGYGAYVFTR